MLRRLLDGGLYLSTVSHEVYFSHDSSGLENFPSDTTLVGDCPGNEVARTRHSCLFSFSLDFTEL